MPGCSHQVALGADPSGHYLADATIDGVAIEVMVDTGATIVALTAETARRLGIDWFSQRGERRDRDRQRRASLRRW